MTDNQERRPRRAARVLLVNAQWQVLLFRGFDPGRPDHRYWFTPGGGHSGDEPAAEAAARELFEETGLQVAPEHVGEPVWRDITEFPFEGRWYRQEQVFFLVRVESWTVDTTGFDEVERRSIEGHRWWTVEELEATADRVYPPELPGLLRRLGSTVS